MSKEDWIPCSDRYPDAELTYESSFNNNYTSEPVLVQTKRDELFIAIFTKITYGNKQYKDKHEWFTYGTGGRRMKVMSKVIAWMELPEKYKEEKNI